MNYFKYLVIGTAAAALSLSAVSCGDSGTDEPGSSEITPDWSASEKGDGQKITTDEQAKEYLGETAGLVLDKFRPADQKPLAELAVAFARDYEDYTIELGGSTFSGARPRSSRALGGFFAELRAAAAAGDHSALSRAAGNVITFGLFTGIYEPDSHRKVFARTADSKNLVVRFYRDGAPCELTVIPSSDTWTFDAHQVSEGDIDEVKVPRTITFDLTQGQIKYVNGTLKTNYAEDREMTFATDVTALNIRAVSSTEATNSLISTNDAVYIDGTELVNASGKINGKNMVNGAALENIMDTETYSWQQWNGYDYVTRYETYYEVNPVKATNMFQSAQTSAKLLGRVNIVAQVPDSKKFLDIEDTWFDSDDYDSDSQARAACQKACDRLNAAAPAKLFLAGNSTATASLKWQPRRTEDDYGYGYVYTYWEAEPVLSFADGSTYSFAEYGIADFANIENRFISLARAYEAMFNSLF
ncbi:MAG: hypothetical protein K2G30_01250 [Muribaculaceae bacterium]|nr:hypothetical protein [Muribaculaceae bacterium]